MPKLLILRTLFAGLCLVAATACVMQGSSFSGGNGTPYGGDPLVSFEGARSATVQLLEKIKSEGKYSYIFDYTKCPIGGTKAVCNTLEFLPSSNHRAYAAAFLQENVDKFIQQAKGAIFVVKEGTAADYGLSSDLVAQTALGPVGPIIVYRKSALPLSFMAVVAVFTHELGHRVSSATTKSVNIQAGLSPSDPYITYVRDTIPHGNYFNTPQGGAWLLDSIGAAIAIQSAEPTVSDVIESDFNLGKYFSVAWFSNLPGLALSGAGVKDGSFESRSWEVAGKQITWTSFGWNTLFPVGKELPSQKAREVDYTYGNQDMSTNVLLMHFNESVANSPKAFSDSSTSGVVASCSGSSCPTASSAGVFNTSVMFNENHLTVPDSERYDRTSMTFSAWITANADIPKWGTVFIRTTSDVWTNGYGLAYVENELCFYVTNWASAKTCAPYTPTSQFTHVAVTVQPDDNGSVVKIFFNGVVAVTATVGTEITRVVSPLDIGNERFGRYGWSGRIDELAFFDRAFTSQEVSYLYKRGAGNLRFQIRACQTADCQNQTFMGPDGTANTYFSELMNTTASPVRFPLGTNFRGRYFQYRALFSGQSGIPALSSVYAQGQ